MVLMYKHIKHMYIWKRYVKKFMAKVNRKLKGSSSTARHQQRAGKRDKKEEEERNKETN